MSYISILYHLIGWYVRRFNPIPFDKITRKRLIKWWQDIDGSSKFDVVSEKQVYKCFLAKITCAELNKAKHQQEKEMIPRLSVSIFEKYVSYFVIALEYRPNISQCKKCTRLIDRFVQDCSILSLALSNRYVPCCLICHNSSFIGLVWLNNPYFLSDI